MGESKEFITQNGLRVKLTRHTAVLFTIEVFETTGDRVFHHVLADADKAEYLYKTLCEQGGSPNGHANQPFRS